MQNDLVNYFTDDTRACNRRASLGRDDSLRRIDGSNVLIETHVAPGARFYLIPG